MVSPYLNSKQSGGYNHSRGVGTIKQSMPLDAEGGQNVVSEFRKNIIAKTDRSGKSHVRPGWSPGYNR